MFSVEKVIKLGVGIRMGAAHESVTNNANADRFFAHLCDSYGRKPSNTTSTVENLEKKGFIEFVAGENLHAHKTFQLTPQGYAEVRDLMGRLARKNFSAVG